MTKQTLFRMDKESLKILEDFQFNNRIPNRTEALRRLLLVFKARTAPGAFDWLPAQPQPERTKP